MQNTIVGNETQSKSMCLYSNTRNGNRMYRPLIQWQLAPKTSTRIAPR